MADEPQIEYAGALEPAASGLVSEELLRLLDKPSVFLPFLSGRYTVAPGLNRYGTDFGNGEADGKLFQIDSDWPRFRQSKLDSRTENFDKYIRYDDFEDRARRGVARLMAQRMAIEYPEFFVLMTRSDGVGELTCRLTGETLHFDNSIRLVSPTERYRDAFDALCCQVQEDIAIVRRSPERGEWLAALHICHPSRWSPQEKIGKSFAQVHIPVPGMARTISAAASLTEMMIHGQPYVRFVWSIEPTDRLNRHPVPPPGVAPATWNRRGMIADGDPPFWVRVERQSIVGLPGSEASLFAIRVYHVRGDALRADERTRLPLRRALATMDIATVRYKGLEESRAALVNYLDAPVDSATVEEIPVEQRAIESANPT